MPSAKSLLRLFAGCLGGWLLLASPARGIEAIAVRVGADRATFQLRETCAWQPPLRLRCRQPELDLMLVELDRGRAETRPVVGAELAALRVGTRVDLQPIEGVAPTAPTTNATTPAEGRICHLGAEGIGVALTGPPPLTAEPAIVYRDGRPVATLRWVEDDRTHWNAALVTGQPQLLRVGDPVRYVASAETPVTVKPASVTKPAPRRAPFSAETMLAGDDPLLSRLAWLAARGYIPAAGQNDFRGELVGLYTRGQILDFLVAACEQLLDPDRLTPSDTIDPQAAAQLRLVLGEFREELLSRGVDLSRVDAAIEARRPANNSWLLTGQGVGRLGTGEETARGLLEASIYANLGQRFKVGLDLGTEGGQALPDDRDRSHLSGYFGQWDISRHLTAGVGRLSTRFGPGLNDLLWSDRAKTLDQVWYRYHTNLLGRPFSYTQRTGYFRDDIHKYVTVQRYEYLPTRRLSLAMSFGLVTDKSGQAAASFFLPAYLSRFVAGEHSRGGSGNFLGSVDAAYRVNREWSLYGQVFADEFDFSPKPPKTAQRIGFLSGLQYTPAGALTGTAYRLEGVIIPDRGTYVGQQDSGLAWRRDGVLLGHPYGQDAAGIRFDARHRLDWRWDILARAEYYNQLRSFAVSPETTRLGLTTRYDLTRFFTVGLGLDYRRDRDSGGILGNSRQATDLFLELQAGY